MPYTEFLDRIRRLFKSKADAHRDDIARALRKGSLVAPARPMSDQELAQAIKEFQVSEISDWARQRLAKRPQDASKAASRGPVR